MRLSLAIEKTRGGIFQIKHSSHSQLGAGLGTAFAVREDGILITAKHVVEGYQDNDLALAYGVPGFTHQGMLKVNGMFFGIPGASVIATDDENDLAAIKLPKALSEYKFQIDNRMSEFIPHVIPLELEEPVEGDAIAASGYPLHEPSLVTTSGNIASNWTLEHIGNDKYERYLGDITVNGGNSGGPVYRLQNAKVVGVAVAYKTAPSTDVTTGEIGQLAHNSGLTIIVPAQAIEDFLGTI